MAQEFHAEFFDADLDAYNADAAMQDRLEDVEATTSTSY